MYNGDCIDMTKLCCKFSVNAHVNNVEIKGQEKAVVRLLLACPIYFIRK